MKDKKIKDKHQRWSAADIGPLIIIAGVVSYYVFLYIERFGLGIVVKGIIAGLFGLLVFIGKIIDLVNLFEERKNKDN